MPYISQAQHRYFRFAEARGELPEGTASRWAHETPNLKKLPDKKRKKCQKKEAQAIGPFTQAYRMGHQSSIQPQNYGQHVRQGLQSVNGVSPLPGLAALPTMPRIPQQKLAGMFDTIGGLYGDVKNTIWGENNLGRLQSWNRVKGYLPSPLRNYITEKHVNPAVSEGIQNAVMAGLGTAGSGLLGLYWLYNGLTKPATPAPPPSVDTEAFMHPSVSSMGGRSINERLGFDSNGRPPLK